MHYPFRSFTLADRGGMVPARWWFLEPCEVSCGDQERGLANEVLPIVRRRVQVLANRRGVLFANVSITRVPNGRTRDRLAEKDARCEDQNYPLQEGLNVSDERTLSDLATRPAEAAAVRKETHKTITIPACVDHRGMYQTTLRVPWVCLICGGPRGELDVGESWDGSLRMMVNVWKNPCGHVERYSAVRIAAGMTEPLAGSEPGFQ